MTSPAAPAPSPTAPASPPREKGRTTIRARLGVALAIGLSPILLLGLTQAFAGFRHDAEVHQRTLLQSAQRSAVGVRGRIQAAVTLMETLTPETTGFECSARLAEAKSRLPGYLNLVRLNSLGRVTCSAASVVYPDRHDTDWFKRVQAGETMVIAQGQTVPGRGPVVLSVVRVNDAAGKFDGAILAAMPLETLKPDLDDPTLGAGTQVSIADAQGHLVISTDPKAFGTPPPHWTDRVKGRGGLYSGQDSAGVERDFAAAPLMDRSVFVVLSAPASNFRSWAGLNPVVSILLPLLAWLVAWGAIWFAVDGQVIRWLLYLDRIASIYARGRFSVRPVAAEKAPAEIRALAHTLDLMATALVARDETLRENLAQKDALMREIHHRVKNNLQVITSLLNMQQRALTDPAARAAMYDTRQRINALALIYRALYQSPDLRRVDVRQFLEELIAQMVTGEGVAGSRVRSEFQADDLEIDPDKLAPLALFAVEALTNARKHAYPDGEGVVRIRFKVADDEAMLEISDDGQGDSSLGGAAGVGRTLMTAFARQLRGRVEFIGAEGTGLCVRLSFPTPEVEHIPDISARPFAKGGNHAVA